MVTRSEAESTWRASNHDCLRALGAMLPCQFPAALETVPRSDLVSPRGYRPISVNISAFSIRALISGGPETLIIMGQEANL